MKLDAEELERFSKPPILVGLNNPWSSLPEHILSPQADRPNCTGSRILRLIRTARPGYLASDFLSHFPDRFNLDSHGSEIIFDNDDSPRNFVLFGKVVAEALIGIQSEVDRLWNHLQETPPAFAISMSVGTKHRHGIYLIPHPSGLNRWYNEPRNRRAVGEFLWRLAKMTK
jgi:hypothetical protein